MSGGVDSSVAAARCVARGVETLGVTLAMWPGDRGAGPRPGMLLRRRGRGRPAGRQPARDPPPDLESRERVRRRGHRRLRGRLRGRPDAQSLRALQSAGQVRRPPRPCPRHRGDPRRHRPLRADRTARGELDPPPRRRGGQGPVLHPPPPRPGPARGRAPAARRRGAQVRGARRGGRARAGHGRQAELPGALLRRGRSRRRPGPAAGRPVPAGADRATGPDGCSASTGACPSTPSGSAAGWGSGRTVPTPRPSMSCELDAAANRVVVGAVARAPAQPVDRRGLPLGERRPPGGRDRGRGSAPGSRPRPIRPGWSPPARRSVELRFPEPAGQVSPGQAVVLYRGDEVLGGGVVEAAA